MIGIHLQKTLPGWLEAIVNFPTNTWHLVVEDQHMCRDLVIAGQRQGKDYKVALRHMGQRPQTPGGSPEECREIARTFFNEFIPGTFMEQGLYNYVSAIKTWNEHIVGWPPNENEIERRFILQEEAFNWVWKHEWQQKYPDALGKIPLICMSIPVGNPANHDDFNIEFGRIIARYNAIASYHGYCHVVNGEIDPLDWQHHSGRHAAIDRNLRRNGITVRWLLTEGGPYLGVYEGWRHPRVLNGNFEAYLDVVRYLLDNFKRWNAFNGGRLLGQQLFTFGRTGDWDFYELDVEHIARIGQVVSEHEYQGPKPEPTPEPVPPPQEREDGDPRIPYRRHMWVVPQEISKRDYARVTGMALPLRRTVTFSLDEPGTGRPGVSIATLWNLDDERKQVIKEWYERWYPHVEVRFDELPNELKPIEIHDIVNELTRHKIKRYRKRLLDDITHLTIHHTVSPPDRPIEQIAAYHVDNRNWPGIGYHFVITDKGEIFMTNYLTTKSYHAGTDAPGDENLYSVGIALQGNFMDAPPPQAQLKAAHALVLHLKSILGLDLRVVGHKEMPGAETACPGATWDNYREAVE